MSYPIEVVSVGGDFYGDILPAMEMLNECQAEFRFKLPPDRMKSDGLHVKRNDFHKSEVFEFLAKYCQTAGGHRPFVIAIVNGSLRSDKYSRLFGSHETLEDPPRHFAVVTLKDHERYVPSRLAFVSYYLTRYSLSFVAPGVLAHPDPVGCFFDKKLDKRDIVKSLESGDICDRCRQELQDHMNPEIEAAVESMVLTLKACQNKPNPSVVTAGGKVMPQKAIDTWKEKIDYLEQQLAQTSDAEQKFSILKKIEEAKHKLAELSAPAPQPTPEPHATSASLKQADSPAIDVAIVIPLQEEFNELHAEIEDVCRAEKVGNGAYDYLFSRSGATGSFRCVATFVGDMGETKAGLRTKQIIDKWNPKTVVVLGIAAGISKDVMVGDIVVGTLVDSYLQNAKAVDEGDTNYTFEFSGEAYRPSGDLVNESRHLRFAHRAVFKAWGTAAAERLRDALSPSEVEQLISKKLVREQPVAETGHIASGPVVAAAKAFIALVRKKDRKYLALEMESGGVLAAVYEVAEPSHSLVIRGISDLGDGRKDELDAVGSGGLRRYAMQNAIQFLWRLLECDALP